MTSEELTQLITNKRESLGISKLALSIDTGLNINTIKRIEKDVNNCHVNSLLVVLKELNIELATKDIE